MNSSTFSSQHFLNFPITIDNITRRSSLPDQQHQNLFLTPDSFPNIPLRSNPKSCQFLIHTLSNVLFSYHFHILFYTSSCSQHTLLSPWKGSNLSINSAAQITFRYLVYQSTVNPNLSWITTKLLQAPSSLHRLWLTHFPNSISYFPT